MRNRIILVFNLIHTALVVRLSDYIIYKRCTRTPLIDHTHDRLLDDQ